MSKAGSPDRMALNRAEDADESFAEFITTPGADFGMAAEMSTQALGLPASIRQPGLLRTGKVVFFRDCSGYSPHFAEKRIAATSRCHVGIETIDNVAM